MRVRIEQDGRIELPKPVLERLGLEPGASLELEECADGLTLRVAEGRPSLVRDENGLLVHTGRLPDDVNWDMIVDEQRGLTLRDVMGR